LRAKQTVPLASKHFKKEVTSGGRNILTLKMLMYIKERFRSFHTTNIGYVNQRAQKLPSVKLENDFDPVQTHVVQLGPSGRLFLRPPNLIAINFAAL